MKSPSNHSPAPPIKVAFADHHNAVRKSIIYYLESLGGIEVILDANDGKQLIELIHKSPIKPDVCLIDIQMPIMDGFDTLSYIHQTWPEIGTLVFTAFKNDAYKIRMILNGASGYLHKTAHPHEVKEAIEEIFKNGKYYTASFSPRLIEKVLMKKITLPELSAKEAQFLQLCLTELTYKQIADEMKISFKSVDNHRNNLFKKLGVKSRVGLALSAIKLGIFSEDYYPA